VFVRRRPLLRAAVVGGGAYVAGKRSGQRTAESQQEQQQQGPGPEEQGGQPSVSDQLAQLSSLHAQGSLSDAEFARAKARLLGS
jgi:Short C-terminal domain